MAVGASRPRTGRSKIVAPAPLARMLASARRAKKRVVFTNGCFDLLHKGHVSYLERARTLGAILVVALNEDRSVRKLKGPGRPVNGLADRLDVIAALEAVDYVTWFGQDTPLDLIVRLQPDVLVKGQDYRLDEIVGAREVKAWGGCVKRLPFVRGRSTTSILARARKLK